MKTHDDSFRGTGGAQGAGPAGKIRITIRLDSEIIDWFRSKAGAKSGGNYQTMINDALKEYVNQGGEPLETLLRRVIREELGQEETEAEAPVIPRGRL
jgi:hypothetical protein